MNSQRVEVKMSEKVKSAEHRRDHEHRDLVNESAIKSHESTTQPEQQDDLDTIRKSIEQYAEKSDTVQHRSQENNHELHHEMSDMSSSAIKQKTYQKTIKNTQKHLKPLPRAFSRIVPNPVVESSSVVLEKTLARPQGIILGSLFGLAGSLFMYFTAKKFGFSYNFLVFGLLYVGFYIVGLIVEPVMRQLFRLIKK